MNGKHEANERDVVETVAKHWTTVSIAHIWLHHNLIKVRGVFIINSVHRRKNRVYMWQRIFFCCFFAPRILIIFIPFILVQCLMFRCTEKNSNNNNATLSKRMKNKSTKYHVRVYETEKKKKYNFRIYRYKIVTVAVLCSDIHLYGSTCIVQHSSS